MFLILHTLFGVLLHKFRQNKVFIQQSIVWIWNFVRCNMGLPAVVSELLFCCRLVAASCLQDRKKGRHADGNLPKCKKESLFWPSFLVTPTGLKPVTFWSVVRCSIQLSYGAIPLLRVQMWIDWQVVTRIGSSDYRSFSVRLFRAVYTLVYTIG